MSEKTKTLIIVKEETGNIRLWLKEDEALLPVTICHSEAQLARTVDWYVRYLGIHSLAFKGFDVLPRLI